MIRNALIGLGAVSLAALGASAANAGSYGGYNDNYSGYNDDNYQPVGYYCHYHTKKVRVKVLVGYDYYGNPIYKYRYKYVRYCHKHYNDYNAY